eukprot:TRINITY_DN85_c0_g1_i2.p1 TRINITY_DN85_c0_g1~~TRINITY_DN85_c0_g1_i2.p1  ORF type:complete len:610 (-),score=140.18 TRINITY_DN85_c0_g1_i2:212-2041(-)
MINSTLLRLLVVFVLIHLSHGALKTTYAGSTLDRFNQFITTLTTLLSDGATRAVHSSGGAAGGVVSEGQGYGLLIGGITSASLGSTHTSFNDVVTKTYQIFKGWKKMCMLSLSSASCQATVYSCTDGSTSYPCLPHWKFDDKLVGAAETGNAPDGDEDAILGMIVLVMATESVKSQYTWWNEVAKWTYQSCKQFYTSNTDVKVINGVTHPMLKLGACWGGWDCNNPSYHAPGAYRAFLNYIARYATTFGDNAATVTQYTNNYNNLIATSYAVILADQCDTSGLTTNWYKPNSVNPALVGDTSCSGSGTPSGEYGAEAARGVWRVALDYVWYGDTTNTANYLDPIIKHVASTYSGGSFGSLSTCGLVTAVFSQWTAPSNAFIFGPTLSALLKPLSTVSGQQAILDSAGKLVAGTNINAYYAGAWTAITTFTLNGDLERVGSLVRGGPLPPPVPTPPVAPPPVIIPTPVSGSGQKYTCSYAYEELTWIEINMSVTMASDTKVYIECGSGKQYSCVYNWNKWQCNPSPDQCTGPRNVVVKGSNAGCCDLGRGCSKAVFSQFDQSSSTNTAEEVNAGLVAGIVVASLLLVGLLVFLVYQVKTRYYDFKPLETI